MADDLCRSWRQKEGPASRKTVQEGRALSPSSSSRGETPGDDSVLTVTYRVSEDDLTMTDQVGDSYTAKFDGKDYPYKGDPGVTTVSLKKIDANTIEETDKLNGKVIS